MLSRSYRRVRNPGEAPLDAVTVEIGRATDGVDQISAVVTWREQLFAGARLDAAIEGPSSPEGALRRADEIGKQYYLEEVVVCIRDGDDDCWNPAWGELRG